MLYAAYGSNLHPVRLVDRIASAELLATAWLPNWSLRFHKRSKDDSGKCSIFIGDDGVHFAIFEVSAEDKQALDGIEGLGQGYAEISLDMPGVGRCFSYIAEESYVDAALRPYDWYKELVLAGARYHGFPDRYLKEIEAVEALRDPDPERGHVQWRTVERVKAAPDNATGKWRK